MTQYRRGVGREYAARDKLLADGYPVVIRSAGSHSQFDLVALGRTNIKLVQVKSVRRQHLPSFEADLEAMRAVTVPDCAIVELWIWHAPKREWIVVPV